MNIDQQIVSIQNTFAETDSITVLNPLAEMLLGWRKQMLLNSEDYKSVKLDKDTWKPQHKYMTEKGLTKLMGYEITWI